MSILTTTIPDYIPCPVCGHPADAQEEDKSESTEDYTCYTFKCVKCGNVSLSCFRPVITG